MDQSIVVSSSACVLDTKQRVPMILNQEHIVKRKVSTSIDIHQLGGFT
jgi:hypothetical protein